MVSPHHSGNIKVSARRVPFMSRRGSPPMISAQLHRLFLLPGLKYWNTLLRCGARCPTLLTWARAGGLGAVCEFSGHPGVIACTSNAVGATQPSGESHHSSSH